MSGGALSLPLINLLSHSVAQAEGEDMPLRFIGMYHPHGVAAEHWVMRDTDTEDNFDLQFEGSSLSPFDDPATFGKSFKDKIIPIEGLELQSSAGGHDSAGTILTGSRIAGTPSGMSLDQYLAVELGLGNDTRIASAALAVGLDGSASGQTLSYGPGGAPLPKIIDPVQAFDLFFAGFVLGDDPAAIALAARKRVLGQSVIDFVNADINRLYPRLAAREQQKLDQHLTSLRELEKQFQDPGSNVSCAQPSAPDAANFPKFKQFNGGEPYFSAISEAMVDIMAQAMACDITRFGSILLNDQGVDSHTTAHTYAASPIGNNGRPGVGNPGSWARLADLNRYNYAFIARLMQRLDEFGILDNTLIYATSDMGNPALHSTRNVPTLLAGGAGGRFRMGRRLKMADDCPPTSPYCGPTNDAANYSGTPSNKLLVSIAQAFGAEIDSFGDQPDGSNQGTLPGLV